MHAVRISLLAGLLTAPGCCLTVVSGTETDETSGSGGSTTGGGGSSSGGGGTSGGTTTGGACSGVYCSPSYVCDPTDGICKCGGQICTSGNCDPDGGECLPAGCPSDGAPVLTGAPGEADMIPPAVLNRTYNFQIGEVCAYAPTFTALSPLPPGLALYPTGEIEGVPSMATNGVPFEFEVEAQAPSGATASQNFLLQVIASP